MEYIEKTTELPQVTEQTLSYNAVSSIPCMSGIQNDNFSGDSIFRVV